MRKNNLLLLTLLITSIATGFSFAASPPQNSGNSQEQKGADEEAARLYRRLASLPMRDRRTIFNSLTPEAKSGLWKVHLRSYVTRHPDLTEEQREAIQSTIPLITPGLFATPQGTPEWQTNVHQPLQRLTEKFLEVFSPKVAAELLEMLGGPEPPQQMQAPDGPSIIKSSLRRAQEMQCTCSTQSDWCSSHHGKGWRCVHGSGACSQTFSGCGTLLVYSCVGQCFNADGPVMEEGNS